MNNTLIGVVHDFPLQNIQMTNKLKLKLIIILHTHYNKENLLKWNLKKMVFTFAYWIGIQKLNFELKYKKSATPNKLENVPTSRSIDHIITLSLKHLLLGARIAILIKSNNWSG